MKLAKRIITIMLIASLCFSLVACASANILGVSTPTTPLAVSDGSTVSDFETPVAYRNDYFQYSCVLADDWYVMNEDEISEVFGITYEMLGDSVAGDIIQESFDSGESQMDFYAFSGDGTQTINIVLGKAKMLELLLPEQMLLEAATPLLISGLEDMGVTNVTHSIEQVDFLGEERVALFVQGETQGVILHETIVVMRKGFYLSTFTLTSMEQTTARDPLNYFHVID